MLVFVRACTKTAVLTGGAVYWTQTDLTIDYLEGFIGLMAQRSYQPGIRAIVEGNRY